MVATCLPQSIQGFFEGAKGVAGGPHACINRPDDRRARNSKKKEKTSKSPDARKVSKKCKEGKQHKNSGKKCDKREQEDRTSNTALSNNTPKPDERKKKTETATNRAERGTLTVQILSQQEIAKLELVKWVKKNNKNKKTTQPNRANKNIYIKP